MATSGSLMTLSPNYLVILFLMSIRISALLLMTPLLGSRTVPAMTKIGLAIIVALVLLPATAPKATIPPTMGYLIIAIMKEVAVGLLAGFAVTLLYASLQIAATLAGIQMGFGFANTVDVTYGGQSQVLDQLFSGIAMLIFLTGNFHHTFLIGVQGLFDMLPPNSYSLFRVSPEGLVDLSVNMFLVAMRIILPLIGALLLTEIALGMMARTAPQMNVFFVGMPVKVALGILAIILILPLVVNIVESMFGQVAGDMALILRFR